MKAKVDRSGCISCELCTIICPEVFRMADDGLAEVYGNTTETNANLVQEAVEGCPVSVIFIEE